MGSGWFPGAEEPIWTTAGGGRGGAEGRAVGQAPCSCDQASECGSQGYGLPWFCGTEGGGLHDPGGPSVSAGTPGGGFVACASWVQVGRGFWFPMTLSVVWTVSGSAALAEGRGAGGGGPQDPHSVGGDAPVAVATTTGWAGGSLLLLLLLTSSVVVTTLAGTGTVTVAVWVEVTVTTETGDPFSLLTTTVLVLVTTVVSVDAGAVTVHVGFDSGQAHELLSSAWFCGWKPRSTWAGRLKVEASATVASAQSDTKRDWDLGMMILGGEERWKGVVGKKEMTRPRCRGRFVARAGVDLWPIRSVVCSMQDSRRE